MPTSKNKHLSLADRSIIEAQLNLNKSFSEIARLLNVNKSTISREVKKHIQEEYSVSRNSHQKEGTYDCAFISECATNSTFCTDWNKCVKWRPAPCEVRDRKGFCNGCEKAKGKQCKLSKKKYVAEDAHLEYEGTLYQSRIGINLSPEQLAEVADFVEAGTKNGHSLAVIAHNNPQCPVSVRTLYNYVDDRRFAENGVINMDLPEKKRRRRCTKYRINKKQKTKPRACRKHIQGRTFEDFLKHCAENPKAMVWEMDTVYNRQDGPYIQTFILRNGPGLLLARFQTSKTAEAMYQGLKALHDALGHEDFNKLFPVILTDRGTEFTAAEKMEELGCRVFYCDPMQSIQKAKVENKHHLLRRIIPNEADLFDLGLKDQEAIEKVVSHINSYPVESLNWRTPYESFAFNYGEDSLHKLNITKIAADEVCLKPDLLKR